MIPTYEGLIPFDGPRPYYVGSDFAGTVEACGSSVSGFSPGDRVWGSNQGLLGRQGTAAEFIAVDPAWVYKTPDAVASSDAAAIALVGLTSAIGLIHRAKAQPDETLFINGGSGGVGSSVIQMGKALGLRVIASAGSDEKCQLCRDLGADLAINYRSSNPIETLKECAPSGVNIWWETTRNPNLSGIIESMAEFGRLVLMAGREAKPTFPVGPFYVKNLTLHGFVMFKASSALQSQCATQINHWLENGQLRANIAKTLALEAMPEAHQLQEDNTLHSRNNLAGKIVVTV